MTKVSDILVPIGAPIRNEPDCASNAASAPLVDTFSDDQPPGDVVGTIGAGGATRLGIDLERQIAIDHGALRFQPLISPGWGRQGIAYGPFRRKKGLAFAVSITNGHNTSQGSSIQENFVRRIHRWALGPNAEPWPARLAAWIRGPRRKGSLRRFLWWMRSTPKNYRLPNFNENLAIGWFTSAAPANPLVDGCGFVLHAAEGENGELWVRTGIRCLSVFRRLKNLHIYYVVALREQGAIYYAASVEGARGVASFPMMRPIAIDPFNNDQTLFAGVHQCVLGQIGFRVDTRVYGIHIAQIPEFSLEFDTAHACDRLKVENASDGTGDLDSAWHIFHGLIVLTSRGATAYNGGSLAVLDPHSPSGLIHGLVETSDAPGVAGFVWRFRDDTNYWLLKLSSKYCALVHVENGTEVIITTDQQRHLKPNTTHSVQIIDAHGQFGCYLDGERLFDAWFHDDALQDATGSGIWFGIPKAVWIRNFEAHPREVPLPPSIQFAPPWKRLGGHVALADDFLGKPADLAGRAPTVGQGVWEKTIGVGSVALDGWGAALVRATLQNPHPGRTFYTLPWNHPDFADLEVTITPPGQRRGQSHNCRAGFVFWQDAENYLSFSAYLDDVYHGSSIALFTKRHGFEELYDAIWTMVGDQIDWGKPFRLRVAFDGEHFIVFIDDEPVMQRALTDLYPDDPPLLVTRVGLAINWEWGGDTGSKFERFFARC